MLQSVHHAAYGRKLVDVLCQQRVVDAVGMEGGVGKGNAILIEVVADGNLTAESIATLIKRHLIILVVASLYQNGHAEVSHRDGVDDSNLETEIRQRHDDTVNLITVLAEKFGALQSILAGLDRTGACGGCILWKDDIVVAFVFERLEQLLAHIACKFGIEIGAGADNDTEALFLVLLHNILWFLIIDSGFLGLLRIARFS